MSDPTGALGEAKGRQRGSSPICHLLPWSQPDPRLHSQLSEGQEGLSSERVRLCWPPWSLLINVLQTHS